MLSHLQFTLLRLHFDIITFSLDVMYKLKRNKAPCFVSFSLTQLDGYIARTWPTQKSALGSALDPLADKILISILYISLTYADLIPGTRPHVYFVVFLSLHS